MKPALFLLIVALYLVASGYIAARVCRVFKYRPKSWRIAVWVAVMLLDSSFFLLRGLSSDWVMLNRVVYFVSTTWMPVVLYGSLMLCVMDIARNLLVWTRGEDPYHTPWSVKCATALSAILLAWGYIVAITPEETRYTVYTDKLEAGRELTVALVSDLHSGYAITRSDISKLAKIVNDGNADMTIICGDLVDGDLAPVLKEDILAPLSKINSPLGIFAVLGNHDYFDDPDAASSYIGGLKDVTLLRDSVAVAGPFRIIGREDVIGARLAGVERRDIADFGRADSLFTIVADHQPSGIKDAVDVGADLSVSGHTHGGQLWPMNIITKRVFDLDYGSACYGSTTAIVTSGFGTWGPRVRLGSNAEVAFIDIKGTSRK